MNKKNVILISCIIIIIAIVGIAFISTNKKSEDKPNQQSFSIKYNGIEIAPGTEFKEENIKEKAEITEIPSCAFEGTDKVYTYENIEITVAKIDGKDKVYSVYFIDETPETAEGVKISDSKDLMIEKYGTDYKEELGNKYTYTKGNVELSFIIENDTITSIVYTLITKD